MAKKTGSVKKKVVKVDAFGQAHVHSTFNNVIITLTNGEGQVISWSSAGKMGFRGSKKNTPYAAQTAAQDCAKVAYDLGLRKVKVYVKGPGSGRESAIRTINGAGIEVVEIVDVTPLPHNGWPAAGTASRLIDLFFSNRSAVRPLYLSADRRRSTTRPAPKRKREGLIPEKIITLF